MAMDEFLASIQSFNGGAWNIGSLLNYVATGSDSNHRISHDCQKLSIHPKLSIRREGSIENVCAMESDRFSNCKSAYC
jgi:hypothetical protein